MVLVQVDINNGVFVVNNLADFNAPLVVSEQDFYDYLENLPDSAEYGCELSDEMADKINEEYGITGYK